MNKGVIAGAAWVHPNEPCYLIYEINEPAPDSRSVHRYRHILVSRNDRLAEYVEDLGLASNFPNAHQSQVKTGGMTNGIGWSEHSVAEAVGIIKEYRYNYVDIDDLPRLRDLEEGYLETNEMRGHKKMFAARSNK